MLGTASDEGDDKAEDPVLKQSSRVQAVVVFDEAGHGFGKEDAAKAMTEMVKWFQTHMGEK